MTVYNNFNGKISPTHRRLSDALRIRFLAALGRSGKSVEQAATEFGMPPTSVVRWVGSGHLAYSLHPPVEKWIERQPPAPKSVYERVRMVVSKAHCETLERKLMEARIA